MYRLTPLDEVGSSTVRVHRIVAGGLARRAGHRELIDLIAKKAPAAKIEAVAREHKLRTAQSFRTWQAEHQPEG